MNSNRCLSILEPIIIEVVSGTFVVSFNVLCLLGQQREFDM